MRRRRTFLIQVPLGFASLLAACRGGDTDAESAPPPREVTPGRPAAAPLLAEIPADAPTLRWTPEHRDLVYTFGGAAPKHRIAPDTRIVSWTEDCFDGFVKTASDLPSQVMPPGHDNPQTGPFYVEGAEPGDTIAVH